MDDNARPPDEEDRAAPAQENAHSERPSGKPPSKQQAQLGPAAPHVPPLISHLPLDLFKSCRICILPDGTLIATPLTAPFEEHLQAIAHRQQHVDTARHPTHLGPHTQQPLPVLPHPIVNPSHASPPKTFLEAASTLAQPTSSTSTSTATGPRLATKWSHVVSTSVANAAARRAVLATPRPAPAVVNTYTQQTNRARHSVVPSAYMMRMGHTHACRAQA